MSITEFMCIWQEVTLNKEARKELTVNMERGFMGLFLVIPLKTEQSDGFNPRVS